MTNNNKQITKKSSIFYSLAPKPCFRKGFTVLELVIAMGVFIALMGVISGIFVGSIRSQRTLVELITANDTANLALEQMTREIRTGSDFCIPQSVNPVNCSTFTFDGDMLAFVNVNGSDVVYRLQNDVIERSADGGFSFSPLTGNRVLVSRLGFYVMNEILPQGGYLWPPRITITTTIGSQSENLQNIFTDIQTTVSGRNI